ncbi:MAG: potassium channel protein [Acidimicrobiales bacterium]|nr:potassium channel protein [Acidimicrobiales bacterium]
MATAEGHSDPGTQATAGRRALPKMYAGAGSLLAVCLIGVLGYAAAGWRLDDSAFMVVITIFGVGYGEVRPVDTTELRLLTGFIIVAGYGAVIYTVGGFIQLVVDGEINRAFGARRMNKDIEGLRNHTIICGYGRMGQSLAAELTAAGKPFVAIDADPDAFERVPVEGGRPWIVGDATFEPVLERAGIGRAETLATVLSNDAANVFVTVTGRAMNPTMQILARADDRNTEDKLRNCGANTVVLPTDIGAMKMSQLIVRPSAEELLEGLTESGDVDLVQLGLEFDEIELKASSPWLNRTLGEVEVRGAHGYLIVGVRRVDGSTVMHPPADLRLDVDDRVIILGYHDDIPELGTKVVRRRGAYRGIPTDF